MVMWSPTLDGGIETVSCPFCGSAHAAEWASEGGMRAVKCLDCGFVYIRERPAADVLAAAHLSGAHEKAYKSGGRPDSSLAGRAVAVKRRLLAAMPGFKVRQFRRRLVDVFGRGYLESRPVAWLDVGAGSGELLAALSKLAPEGSRLEGVEPNPIRTRRARALGVRIIGASIDEASPGYDVASLVNVFSHLGDPASFLRRVAGVLNPSGELLLATGNAADISPYDYPGPLYLGDHVVFAGQKHVLALLERCGFEVVSIHRYERSLPANALNVAADIARVALGRRRTSPFRFLWFRARLLKPGG